MRFDPTDLKNEIATLLPSVCPAYLTHPLLRMKLAMLRGDILWLLDSMRDSDHPYVSHLPYYLFTHV